MLITRAGVQPGRQVLITGIGGGVALAALDLCRHLGCRTIVTSRHDWKLQRARERGAGETILDTGEGFARQVRAATGGRGVDVCVDSVGQAIHLSCIKSLARGGVFVTCGCTTGSETVTELARLFWNQLTLVGSTMGDRDEFRQVTALLRSGALHPEIDTVYQPHDARAAYQRLESGEQFGKLVVDWGRHEGT
jgi:NADPH:quinone reductase-like Zn-dependent oxidoreductase